MADTNRTILLATDGRVGMPIDALASRLNQVLKHVRFAARTEAIDLGGGQVAQPATFRQIAPVTRPLLERHSLIVIATELAYDNNYFLDFEGSVVIASFANWSTLTNLPKTNGLVGFLTTMLADELDPSTRHDTNTGCVFDFLWDKRGIDAQLRSGIMCRDCFARLTRRAESSPDERLAFFGCSVSEGLADLQRMLDTGSLASRREADILSGSQPDAAKAGDYDVFLCHHSDDKPSVRDLYHGLKKRGLTPWFDEEHLRPGAPWQRELEAIIPRVKAAAIVVGPSGQGALAGRRARRVPARVREAPLRRDPGAARRCRRDSRAAALPAGVHVGGLSQADARPVGAIGVGHHRRQARLRSP